MKTSDNGINFIKSFEGFSAVPYKDIVGVCTWGWGHARKGEESIPAEPLSESDGTKLLCSDLLSREAAVCGMVTVPLNQNQFDALVSFVFNLGERALETSTLLKTLNAGDYAGAAEQILRWNRAGGQPVPGLTRRREAERLLFLS